MSAQFNKPNPPNPGRLMESLRYLGYGNYEAIADLVDNCLDADARQVRITVSEKGGTRWIAVADDGIGMDEPTLDEAMRLGSMTERNPSSDLGRFGMGLVTASLSMAKRADVITKQGDTYWCSAWDIDEVVARNEFCKHLASATQEEVDRFHALAGEVESGTVVVLSKCDGLKNKNTTQFANALRKHLGRVHRYFLQAGATMQVNDQRVSVIDPLELADPKTEIFSDERYAVEILDGDKKVKDSIRVRIALIPDNPSAGEFDVAKSQQAQGFYIMRNQREIMDAAPLDLFSKHNDFNKMRGEIFFPGTLDKYVGIEFTKRDVKLDQSIRDQLLQHVKPQCTTIKRLESTRHRIDGAGEEQAFHDQAAKTITDKDRLLMKPKAVIERRRSHARDSKQEGAVATGDGPKRLALSKTQEADTRLNCEFRLEAMGPGGQIYESDMVGRTIVVRWNVEHPFYRRFVADNLSNDRLVTAVDFLVYSMATAEMSVDDDQREVVNNTKMIISSNLRTLLS